MSAVSRAPGVALPWLTLDRGLFGLILLGGLFIRWISLGEAPLNPDESQRALAAWQLGSSTAPEWWDAPAYVLAQAATFFTFGDNETVARSLALAAGVLTIAALRVFREWLGALPLLVAAGLVALSPMHWAASRTNSEETLAALLTMALLWGLLRFNDEYHPLYRPLTATGLAVLINLGAAGITGVLVLALGTAAVYAVQPQGLPSPLLFRVLVSRPLSRSLLPFLSVFVLLTTGFFLNLKGFGLPSLPAWVQAAAPVSGRLPWYESWLLLGGYELFPLLIGVPMAARYLMRWVDAPTVVANQARGLWSVWGLLGLMVLILGGQPDTGALFMAAFPLTVLAGLGLGDALADFDREAVGPVLSLSLPALGLLWFAYMAVGRTVAQNGDGFPLVAVIAFGSAMAVLALAHLASLRPRSALAATGLTLAVAFSVQALAGLAGSGLRPMETRVYAAGVTPLTDRLALTRYTDAGRTQRIAIEAALRPIYAWQLRYVPGVSFVRIIEGGADLMVADAQTTLPALPNYQRRQLPLSLTWSPQQWSWADAWRWLMWGLPAANSQQARHIVLMERS